MSAEAARGGLAAALAGPYARDGFVAVTAAAHPGAVAPAAAVEAARRDAATLLDAGGAPSGYGRIAPDLWRRSEALAALVAVAAPTVRALLGDARLFQDLVIEKPPRTAADIPWHQDLVSAPLDCADGVVVWLALDDAPEERGCMRYVVGSHRLGLRRPAAFEGAPEPAGEAAARPPMDVDGREVAVVPVRAGELIAHSMLTWHGSGPNRTAQPRRAWSAWFVPADTRWAPHRAAHPLLYELSPADGAPLDDARFPRV